MDIVTLLIPGVMTAISEWIKVSETQLEKQPLIKRVVDELRDWADEYKTQWPLRTKELEDG